MAAKQSFTDAMNKKYGAGSIVKLSDRAAGFSAENVISSGSIALDVALGIGGYPMGRMIEIIGNPSSGKTTLALHAIAEAHARGMKALYIDTEHALDPSYAISIGVDLDALFLSQPDFGEQALQIASEGITSGEFQIVVIDSVAALTPKRELDGEIGDAQIGLQARMMSQGCRIIAAQAHVHNVLVVFINQYRANISTVGYGGETKIASGGKALDYYASVIIDVARIQRLKSNDDIFGVRTKATIKKNKVAAPYREAEFDITFGIGIDQIGEVIDYADEFGFISKSGSWFKITETGESIQGKQRVIVRLAQDAELYSGIRTKVLDRVHNAQEQKEETK